MDDEWIIAPKDSTEEKYINLIKEWCIKRRLTDETGEPSYSLFKNYFVKYEKIWKFYKEWETEYLNFLSSKYDDMPPLKGEDPFLEYFKIKEGISLFYNLISTIDINGNFNENKVLSIFKNISDDSNNQVKNLLKEDEEDLENVEETENIINYNIYENLEETNYIIHYNIEVYAEENKFHNEMWDKYGKKINEDLSDDDNFLNELNESNNDLDKQEIEDEEIENMINQLREIQEKKEEVIEKATENNNIINDMIANLYPGDGKRKGKELWALAKKKYNLSKIQWDMYEIFEDLYSMVKYRRKWREVNNNIMTKLKVINTLKKKNIEAKQKRTQEAIKKANLIAKNAVNQLDLLEKQTDKEISNAELKEVKEKASKVAKKAAEQANIEKKKLEKILEQAEIVKLQKISGGGGCVGIGGSYVGMNKEDKLNSKKKLLMKKLIKYSITYKMLNIFKEYIGNIQQKILEKKEDKKIWQESILKQKKSEREKIDSDLYLDRENRRDDNILKRHKIKQVRERWNKAFNKTNINNHMKKLLVNIKKKQTQLYTGNINHEDLTKNKDEINKIIKKYKIMIKRYLKTSNPILFKKIKVFEAQLYILDNISYLIKLIINYRNKNIKNGILSNKKILIIKKFIKKLDKKKKEFDDLKKTGSLKKYKISDKLIEKLKTKYELNTNVSSNDDTSVSSNDDTSVSSNDDTSVSSNDDTSVSSNDDTSVSFNDDTSL